MHQFEQRKFHSSPTIRQDEYNGPAPKLIFNIFFKLFGIITKIYDLRQSLPVAKSDQVSSKSKLYCQSICVLLWFYALRSFVLIFIEDQTIQLILGDCTRYWTTYRVYYLIPSFFFGIHAAIIATTFLLKEKDLKWLLPFISLQEHQKINYFQNHPLLKHKLRINLWIIISLFFTFLSMGTTSYMFYFTIKLNFDDILFYLWMPWLFLHILWIFYLVGIVMFTLSYFNLICKDVEERFAQISKDVDTLAESEPGPVGSKNDELMRLYYEHNELCELVDESNDFWQSYLFYTAMSYIPCNCYVLYTLFFADMDTYLMIFLSSIFFFTLFVLTVISISAADVSSEAHEPYTSLYTLSLLQLPIDIEVNISTFLHRIRGPTIGYSCLDLFVITNSSVTNTLSAIASYFLIVADFSRSSVNQSMNNPTTTATSILNNLTIETKISD